MTPEERAKELYNEFADIYPDYTVAKDSALKCVEWLILNIPVHYTQYYWSKVKEELEKL